MIEIKKQLKTPTDALNNVGSTSKRSEIWDYMDSKELFDYTDQIRMAAKKRKITLKELSKHIGMTQVGLSQSLTYKTLKVEKLILIAKRLNISFKIN